MALTTAVPRKETISTTQEYYNYGFDHSNYRYSTKKIFPTFGPGVEPSSNVELGQGGVSFVPHVRSIVAGIDKHDPVHKSIFEVSFSIPLPLQSSIGPGDVAYLSQQVISVSGLDALNKTTGSSSQKFLGVDVSYLNPIMDTTSADITINFNLNLRQKTDNWLLRIFRMWSALNYDLADGSRAIKQDYVADFLTIAEANRNGDVWRSYQFRDVMLTGVTNLDDLDYSSNDARTLTCTFRSDYWYDTLAGPVLPAIEQQATVGLNGKGLSAV